MKSDQPCLRSRFSDLAKTSQILRNAIVVFAISMTASVSSSNAEQLIFNTQEFRPFNYTEQGEVRGPAAEVIRLVCENIELDCILKSYPWRRAQKEVEMGNAHALFVIGWNETRSQWLHYSPPLMNTEYGFFVNALDAKTYNRIEQFDGRVVGVYGPSNTSNSLNKLSLTSLRHITIDMTPDDIAAFKKLALNRVGSVYSNRDVGNAIIREHNLKNLRYAIAHRSLDYYIGFSKSATPKTVVEKFNGQLIKLHKEGVVRSIMESYNMVAAELN